MKYDIYIAGAMHGRRGSEVLLEREEVKKVLTENGLTYYDPAEDEDIDPSKLIDSKPDRLKMLGYVLKDDSHLDECAVLLVLTGDYSSSGTAWEMARMYYRNMRPIVVISRRMGWGQLVNFTTIKATAVALEIEEAARQIKWLLGKDIPCHS